MERTIENIRQLVSDRKSIREIANEFSISYTSMRMWMKRRGIHTETTEKGCSATCVCSCCSREYEYNRNKGHRKTVCNSCNVTKARNKLKKKAVDYKGGSCQVCGYSKYQGSLDFHHLDSNMKDFALSDKGACRSWSKVKAEIDKCVLVCKNCHGEIHGGVTNILG